MKCKVLLGFALGCLVVTKTQPIAKVVLNATVVCTQQNAYADDDDRQTTFRKKYGNYQRELSYTWRTPEGTDICYVLMNKHGRDEDDVILQQVDRILRATQAVQELQEEEVSENAEPAAPVSAAIVKNPVIEQKTSGTQIATVPSSASAPAGAQPASQPLPGAMPGKPVLEGSVVKE